MGVEENTRWWVATVLGQGDRKAQEILASLSLPLFTDNCSGVLSMP